MSNKKVLKGFFCACGESYDSLTGMDGRTVCPVCLNEPDSKKTTIKSAEEAEPLAQLPPNAVRLTDTEAETWGRINAEQENVKLRAQNKALELQVAERDWVAKQRDLHAELQALQQEFAGIQQKYKNVIGALATKYEVDPRHVAVDFEARLLYDMREEGSEKEK